jgi:hypothetical protein
VASSCVPSADQYPRRGDGRKGAYRRRDAMAPAAPPLPPSPRRAQRPGPRERGRRRVGLANDDAAGLTEVLGLLATHTNAAREGAEFVAVDGALETDHGLLVVGLRAAGHRVFAINPKAVDRYRDRYAPSGAKSDAVDALVLAHLLRTDRDLHRPMPEDSEQVTALTVLARTHQDCVRVAVRDAARLRSLLREFSPPRWWPCPTSTPAQQSPC